MKFFKSMISDERGAVSSKRIIAIICVLCLCFLMFYPVWCADCKSPSEVIVDAIKYIAMTSIGTTTADKFSFKKETTDGTIEPS
jgi:hypothetical protein